MVKGGSRLLLLTVQSSNYVKTNANDSLFFLFSYPMNYGAPRPGNYHSYAGGGSYGAYHSGGYNAGYSRGSRGGYSRGRCVRCG